MDREGEDRRIFLRRVGTLAWSVPLILTTRSAGAFAQSCIPAGGRCGSFSFGSGSTGPDCAAPIPCCEGLTCIVDHTMPSEGEPCVCT